MSTLNPKSLHQACGDGFLFRLGVYLRDRPVDFRLVFSLLEIIANQDSWAIRNELELDSIFFGRNSEPPHSEDIHIRQ